MIDYIKIFIIIQESTPLYDVAYNRRGEDEAEALYLVRRLVI
jgi:hypothetical protein